MHNFDILLCVLACAKNEKYIKRLMDFVGSYGYKHRDPKIRAKVVFLVEDEDKPDFLDESFGWYNCPGLPLSCRLLKYLKDEPIDYKWLMQVDDDSSTDIDKTMELLDQYYDSNDCLLLMGGRNTDLERSLQNIIRKMNIENFFFNSYDINKYDTTPYFIHAWEPSIFSSSAVARIKSWDKMDDFYENCLNYKPIFGDQVPYVAARFSKVPIVECLFMSPFQKSEEYSAAVKGGRFSHIHYVTEKWAGYEGLKHKMARYKAEDYDDSQENLDPSNQKPIMWEFWAEEDDKGTRFIGVLTLNEDRTIGIYSNDNERYWDMADDRLIFMNASNKPTTVFKKVSESEYSGAFIPNKKVTHKVRRIV